jgi:hypothetical protein
MKRRFTFALGAALALAGLVTSASAATEAQKLAAILLGDTHLDATQNGDGSWGTSNQDAVTGQVVFAFLSHQSRWPPALAAKYGQDVANGINYLLTHASTSTVSVNNSNVNICPGGSGTCTAVYWNVCGDSDYCTGLVAPAIDTFGLQMGINAIADNNPKGAGHPLGMMTWQQIAQGISNAYAAAQGTAANGNAQGAWHYTIPSNTSQDMSTTQWGAIASGYDEASGAITASPIKPNLKVYLAYDLTTSGADIGAACYEGSAGCGIGPTHSEQGAWLVSNQYAGNPLSSTVMAFLNTHWKDTPNATWYGNIGHPYAMWAVYKGLESTIGLADNTHILNLNSNCGAPNNLPGPGSPSGGVCNWWEDYNQYLVGAQNVNGSWTDQGGAWPDPLNTAFFIAILDAAPLPATITGPNPPTVPVASVWGLVALGIMLAGFAALRLRKGNRVAAH